MSTVQAPEAPGWVDEFLAGPAKGLWIDNEYVDSASGHVVDSFDPATGEVLAQVQEAGPGDVDRAVASARAAFEGPWGAVSADDRGRILWRVAELVEQHADELSFLETLDCGKPLAAARETDLPQTAATLRYYAGWATKIQGKVVPVSGDFHAYTRHEPIGVCAGIIPWNYPLMMASWKLAPALACGNTMIVKPAEQTPLSMLRLAELFAEAGAPAGVVTVLNGRGEITGKALAEHGGVDKVAFTGSAEVGRLITISSVGNLKRVSLELGGKSPNVVFDDAPADVAEGALWGIYYNMGQDCTAGSRLFVQKDIYDDLMSDLVEGAGKLRVGPGLSPDTDVAALISDVQLERVLGYTALGKEEGRVLAGGERAVVEGCEGGYYMTPTVVAETGNQARVAQEEIFGPVVVAMPFADEDELVAMANDTPFGLGAGVWTSDVKRAHRVAARIKAGTVWVNCYGNGDPAAPFGGFKQSGHGRELGEYALELYTEVKSVWTNLAPGI